MPGDHVFGIGMGSTEFISMAIEKGRSVELTQTRKDDKELAELALSADRHFRLAFNKGMFQVCVCVGVQLITSAFD